MNPVDQFVSLLDEHRMWETETVLLRNHYLKVGGSTDTRLYHVVEGCLRVFVLDDPEEHTIRFGYRNNLITAIDSFVTEQPSPMYIQALRETVVRAVSKNNFMEFLLASAERLKLWTDLLQLLILQQLEREQDLLTGSPAERYRRVLRRSPQLFQEVPHKYIASYLRMTPETLSRLNKG